MSCLKSSLVVCAVVVTEVVLAAWVVYDVVFIAVIVVERLRKKVVAVVTGVAGVLRLRRLCYQGRVVLICLRETVLFFYNLDLL